MSTTATRRVALKHAYRKVGTKLLLVACQECGRVYGVLAMSYVDKGALERTGCPCGGQVKVDDRGENPQASFFSPRNRRLMVEGTGAAHVAT